MAHAFQMKRHKMSTDYDRDTERIQRGQQARNVSPECWRNEHELCECNALICRCECHREDLDRLKQMLVLRKELDPDAPDMVVFPEFMSEDLIDRVLQILGNPGITETTYAKLRVALAGKAYTAPLDNYVTLLERNNGRLREVLKEALEQTGCDGDLCNYRWHEKARVLLGE